MSESRIVICHVIPGLGTGGAEMMLLKLLSEADQNRFSPVVISLRDLGTIGEKILALDIPVYTLNIFRKKGALKKILKLRQIVRKVDPDLIQGWMYYGNIAALIVKVILRNQKKLKLVWNIRSSLILFDDRRFSIFLLLGLSAKLSHFPQKIIYNSKVASVQHERFGFRPKKTVVIPNGFDTKKYFPSDEFKVLIRKELNLPNNAFLIGLVARYDPLKDHANFLSAAAIVNHQFPNVYFVLVGKYLDWDNKDLVQIIQSLNLQKQVHLLGERHDINVITAALDIASTSSCSEGFPNVIGEAMSCAVPCVVTDVGDSAWIVSATGRVVPPKSPESLANAWKDLILADSNTRNTLGLTARKRVIEHFSLEIIAGQYERLYSQLLEDVNVSSTRIS